MKIVKIKKKKAKNKPQEYRTIYVQNTAADKKKFRSLANLFERIFLSMPNNEVAQGFVPLRSYVSNANAHIGKQYTLNVDLKDFFDNVTVDKLVSKGISQELARSATIDGATRQGLSSSPMAANIAAHGIDEKILKCIENTGSVYTRYADDLSISSDDIQFLKKVRDEFLPKIVEEEGFALNKKKTRIQSAKFGRRNVTGVSVDGEGIHAPRSAKRKLRALKYKLSKETDPRKKTFLERKVRGMEEFVKCKLPRTQIDDEYIKNKKTKFYPTNDNIMVTPAPYIDPSWVGIKNPKKAVTFDTFNYITGQIGIERCIKYLNHTILEENDEGYKLISVSHTFNRGSNWRVRTINRRYLEMKNPSLEGVIHIESVHPSCRTIQDAINYRRFGNINGIQVQWAPIHLT